MKRYYISILATLALTSSLYAGSQDDYIGSIWATGSNYCPTNTVQADGRLLAISDYNTLYALFGTTYGGDGRTNFAVPDLRGRIPIGTGTGKDNSGTNNLAPVLLGQQRGQASVPLTPSNLPAHTHTALFTPSGTTPITVTIPVSANTSGNAITPDSSHNTMAGTISGPGGAAMWSNTMTNPVNIKGVTTSGGAGSGSVAIGNAGNSTPILTVPPELGVTYCVTIVGLFPDKPN